MEEKVNELGMLQTGRCFICLTQTLNPAFQSGRLAKTKIKSVTSSSCSIQCLSRYLRINMGLEKLLNDDGLYYAPSQNYSVSDVEKLTKLNVELCGRCASLNESFLEVYYELEKVQMKVNHSLRLIHAKLTSAVEAASPEKFCGAIKGEIKVDHDNDGLLRKLRIFNKLRKVMMEKSSDKLTKVSPQLILSKDSLGDRKKSKIKSRSRPGKRKFKRSKGFPQQLIPQIDSSIKTEPENVTDANDMDDPDDRVESYFGGEASDSDPGLDDAQEPPPMDTHVEPTIMPTSSQKPYLILLPSKPSSEDDDSPQSVFNQETKKHKCFRCPKQFASAQAATVHYRTAHLQFRYKCKECGKIYRDQSHCMAHHKRKHVGNQHKCPVCNLICGSKDQLRKHKIQSLHMSRYYCPANSSSAEANLKTDPDGDAQGVEESDPLAPNPARRADTQQEEERLRRLNSTTGTYGCVECPTVEYSSRGGFRNHFESVHLKIRFSCGTCGKDFRHRGGYIRHKMTQHMGVTFPCPKCNRQFTIERSLRVHQQTTSCNDSGKPTVDKVCCDICGKSFARITYLKSHHKEVHLNQGGAGEICDVCGKKFKRKENLTRHRRKAHPE